MKGNKGNRPERKLEGQEKRAAVDISFYIKYMPSRFTIRQIGNFHPAM
jgi:hypothetical protein